MAESVSKFEQWAILEIMGHLKLAGYVTEITIAGAGFIRIDVPQTSFSAAYTRIFSPSSLYSIAPCTEEIARGMASRLRAVPVEAYELPKAAPPRIPAIGGDVAEAEAFQEFDEDAEEPRDSFV